jgi:sigma-B regulation protein RsbU (phosphoserine phosphatase)
LLPYNFNQLPNERLALLYNLSQTFNSSLDLNEVLNSVIDQVIAATHAERGFIVLRENEGSLVFQAARGINHTNIDDPQFQISRGLIDQVIHDGEALLTSNAQTDDRLEGFQSVAFLGLTSVMCVPLKVRETMLGAVYVENRFQAGIFREADLELLAAIAASAAIAIENARLYLVAVEKGRMERELQVARRVQSSFIPKEIDQPPGWDIKAYLEAAREVGGDFYDVFALSSCQWLGLVIADVCDKGVGAAMFMALFRSLIRAYAGEYFAINSMDMSTGEPVTAELAEPVDCWRDLSTSGASALKTAIDLTNKYIALTHGEANMFSTLFFGILDATTGRMLYINGGNEPPVLIGKQGIKARLEPTGPVVGLFPDMQFGIGEINFEPGDTLLAYTDGVLDALNTAGELFTEERLLSLLESPPPSPACLIDYVKEHLDEHMAGRDQYDDIALLAVRREG